MNSRRAPPARYPSRQASRAASIACASVSTTVARSTVARWQARLAPSGPFAPAIQYTPPERSASVSSSQRATAASAKPRTLRAPLAS
ncbi:Uncharacterised protein [Burkholderia pseudomallei]|nr:Uncharacterised protein [Burkholderia pseudomallei]